MCIELGLKSKLDGHPQVPPKSRRRPRRRRHQVWAISNDRDRIGDGGSTFRRTSSPHNPRAEPDHPNTTTQVSRGPGLLVAFFFYVGDVLWWVWHRPTESVFGSHFPGGREQELAAIRRGHPQRDIELIERNIRLVVKIAGGLVGTSAWNTRTWWRSRHRATRRRSLSREDSSFPRMSGNRQACRDEPSPRAEGRASVGKR